MDKVLKIISDKDKQSDYSYWKTKTPAERLAAIEFLRQQYKNHKYDPQSRLQRVCKIINQKQR